NGLQTHFCQPGAAVAQTVSPSRMSSQFSASVRMCAYPQECVCTTPFGLPVVPDVYGKNAMSSLDVSAISNSGEASFFNSSKKFQPSLSSPIIKVCKSLNWSSPSKVSANG